MASATEQSQMAIALRAIRQGRTDDAAAAIQACLNANKTPGALAGPANRPMRGSILPYHVFNVPGIPVAANDGVVRQFKISWPTIGANMRVIGMGGSVLSGTIGDQCNVSLGLQCNQQENFATSGRAIKYIPYGCLFPVSQPIFSFVTPRRPYGVPVFSTQDWTGFVVNEGGTDGNITPSLFFLLESDPVGQPSFDVQAYGPRLGVHVIRPDTPAGVPNAAGAGNPSTQSSIYWSTGAQNQRITAWIGEVLSAANVQDQANAAVAVSPNGAEQMVTSGPQQGIGYGVFASLFGNSQGRPERWLAFGSRSRYGIDVWPDEQWTVSYQNLGSASGNITPVVCFRLEND
jgi:hypothetical protein